MWSSKAATLQVLASSMVDTFGHGAGDINKFASLGASGHCPNHIQRDLLRSLQNLRSPTPSRVQAYVIKYKESVATMEKEWIYFFKPSDWIKCLDQHGLSDKIFGAGETRKFWNRVDPKDPKMYKNPIKDMKGYKSAIPFLLHGDAGPHQKHDSLNVYSMQSLLAAPDASVGESMLLLAAVPQSCRATKKKCKELKLDFVEDTWDAIGRELVADFNMLFEQSKAVVWVATADCDHLSKDYGLPIHSSKDNPCMRCKCNKHSMPFTDVSSGALWRHNMFTPEELARTPLTSHWLLNIKGFTHHSFVYDPMHCMDIGASSHAIANVLYEVFYDVLTGTIASKLKELNTLIKEGYDEHGVPHDQRINWIELKHFVDEDAPHQNYPDLQHSAIKARKTRYLVPVAFFLATKFKDHGGVRTRTMFYCLKNLNEVYKIIDRNFLFVDPSDKPLLEKCMSNFLLHYVALAKMATCRVGRGFHTWSFVPKHHYMLHILEDANFLAPRSFWCYAGESMVGLATSIAASCLHGLPAHKISETLCSKYRVAKHLEIIS